MIGDLLMERCLLDDLRSRLVETYVFFNMSKNSSDYQRVVR